MSVHSPSAESSTFSCDQLGDKELVEAVEKMEKNITYLELENEVFTNFLRQNEPQLITGSKLSQIYS